MKYIDADRLKAETEKRMHICDGIFERDSDTYYQGKAVAYQETLSLIDSLQQEHPDCHTVEDWMQHIKNADKLTKDIFSKGPYDVLYDALNHPYQHCYDAIKEFGELCFQTGVNSVKQEQPEVDLKKEVKEWADLMVGASFPKQDGDFISEEDYRSVIRQTAYHFYELGLKSK